MEEGYDYEVVGDVVNDLNCVICLKLMRDAIQVKCRNGMCNGCYEKLEDLSRWKLSRKDQVANPRPMATLRSFNVELVSKFNMLHCTVHAESFDKKLHLTNELLLDEVPFSTN